MFHAIFKRLSIGKRIANFVFIDVMIIIKTV